MEKIRNVKDSKTFAMIIRKGVIRMVETGILTNHFAKMVIIPFFKAHHLARSTKVQVAQEALAVAKVEAVAVVQAGHQPMEEEEEAARLNVGDSVDLLYKTQA